MQTVSLRFFALDQNRIPAKELQLIHLLKVERHDAVVIVHSFVDNKAIRGFLALKDGCGRVLLNVSSRLFVGGI